MSTKDIGPHTRFFHIRLVVRHLLNLATAAATFGIVSIGMSAHAGPNNILFASPTSGTAPLEVTFTGSGSGALEGLMLLDFGDGQTDGSISTIREFTRTHTYTAAGSYTVRLKSGPFCGQQSSTLVTVASVTINVQ
jgi:hypothetical protein